MHRALPHLRVLPATRAECVDGARPCPFVSCRHHLLLNVAEDGRLYMARDLDEDDANDVAQTLMGMPETCSLDVAQHGGISAAKINGLLGFKHEDTVAAIIRSVGELLDRDDFDEREHPEDPYLRYMSMGDDELAETTAELRARQKEKR